MNSQPTVAAAAAAAAAAVTAAVVVAIAAAVASSFQILPFINPPFRILLMIFYIHPRRKSFSFLFRRIS